MLLFRPRLTRETTSSAHGLPPFICLAVLPMTLDRVGQEVPAEEEEPVKVCSTQEAFQRFHPKVRFTSHVSSEKSEFQIEWYFRSLDDFDPARLQEHQPLTNAKGEVSYPRNDLAHLRDYIDALRRALSRWEDPRVFMAWSKPEGRKVLAGALTQMRNDLDKAEACSDSMRETLEEMPGFAFQPQPPLALLARLEAPLSEGDSYEQTLEKIGRQIGKAEALVEDLLRQTFERIRPIEVSYRTIELFFGNAKDSEGGARRQPELYIMNADPSAVKSATSKTVGAVENFIRRRNDNLNFRDDVWALDVPTFLPSPVREKLEDLAALWGLLLISDLGHEKSVEHFTRSVQPGYKYEFLRHRVGNPCQHVLVAGAVRLRRPHWFEQSTEEDGGLYGPPSLAVAGLLSDEGGPAQSAGDAGPWPIRGCGEFRPNFKAGDLDELGMERQVIHPVRDSQSAVCLHVCPADEAPDDLPRSLFSRHLARFLQRSIVLYLTQVSGEALTRELIETFIETPLERLLNEQVAEGIITGYRLFVDKDRSKMMEGICEIALRVEPPAPADGFVLEERATKFKGGY